jgi:hypothetical protein
VIVALTVTLAAAVPAAEARPRLTEYRLTQAEGFVRMTFQGDEAQGCRDRGVCGIGGTSTYTFRGKPRAGEVTWLRHGSETQFLDGFFLTKGETVADVVTAGSPERCVDRVRRTFDSMHFEPGRKRVRFDWRPQGEPIGGGGGGDGEFESGSDPDDLRTRCAGPTSADAAPAMPRGTLPWRVFRSKRSKFHLSGKLPFGGGGFAGTVEWDLRYAMRFVRSRTGTRTGDGWAF